MDNRIKLINERLTSALSPQQLEIIDNSHKHRGHAGAKDGAGHYTLHIASSLFKNKSLIECHRMIYAALGDLLPTQIHAVSIKIIALE